MKTIDFRFRPNTPDAVDGLIHSPFFGDMCAFFNYPERAWSASLDKIVEIMDEHEITGVITGRDVETTYGCPRTNMGVVEMMRAYPHKFHGMAGLDPHKGMQAIDELSRMVNDYGMKGASVDPYLAKLPADHRKFYPIYAKCCELKVPVVISTGPGTRVPGAIMGDASPARVDEVARDFPDLTIVMSHGGYPYVQEACMVCHRNANVYMDLSEYELAPMADVYVDALNKMIGDKVIFASAHPFIEQADAIEIYKKLNISEEVREKVMYKTAAKILGIDKGVSFNTTKPMAPNGFNNAKFPLPFQPFAPMGR